jgi:hypothetical protein
VEGSAAAGGLPAAADFASGVPRQHYSLGAIGWFIELVLSAPCSQRAAARIVSWISALWPGWHQTPCANTGRNWLFRVGLYELTCPQEQGDDWVWLVDHTVQLGAHKGLVVIGLRLGPWQADPRPLEHQDVRLLHLAPMEHSDGQAVRRELKKVVARTGVPRQIVSDGGADLKKGVELFRQTHPRTTHTYDITHKVACLLKKELEADPAWEQFISESNLARRGLALTSAGFLVPPALKTKARYMNLDSLVGWGRKALAYLKRLRKRRQKRAAAAAEARLIEARLKGLRRFRGRLTEWSTLLTVAQAAEHYVRHHGWHAAAEAELRRRLQPLANCARSRRLKNRLLQFAAEQAAAARPGERLIGSTEVLESLIGKYKRLQALHSAHGMTQMILALGAIVGRRCQDTIHQALTHTTTRHVADWCRAHLGPTLQSRRYHAVPPEQNQHPKPLRNKLSF